MNITTNTTHDITSSCLDSPHFHGPQLRSQYTRYNLKPFAQSTLESLLLGGEPHGLIGIQQPGINLPNPLSPGADNRRCL